MGVRFVVRPLLLYAALAAIFFASWALLTFLILFAQEQLLGAPEVVRKAESPFRSGIQIVVGHYNGNLPAERLANLTAEEMNSNNFHPEANVGANGQAVRMTTREELESEKTFGINQFNLWASDRIPLNRSLPDVRRSTCRTKAYPTDLPTTSVIIVYHNEAFSTLLRTITSVIERSPKRLLREIILVDDFSSRKFLKMELERALINLKVTIKVIRARKRIGLIRARLMGAAEAVGDVLTFLDSHCECTDGWLEPLLARIKENRKVAVCPIIDVINDRTFAYQKGIELFRGGFNWNLQFRWYAVPPKIARIRTGDPTQPIPSPTMAGGLFSMDREYFEQMGTYDAGMDIWGGENIEMSFRIWQCGGRIEILPCSHVGHIFRKASPHDFPQNAKSGNILNSNLVRVSEVWMDDWKHMFYRVAPQAKALSLNIDVSDRVELRKKLQCQSFRWYLENVWPDHFFPLPGSMFGRVSHQYTDYCLVSKPTAETSAKNHLSMSQCTLGFDLWQLWIYSPAGQLKSDEHMCLGAQLIPHTTNWNVVLKECGEHDFEFWDYNAQAPKEWSLFGWAITIWLFRLSPSDSLNQFLQAELQHSAMASKSN